MYDALNDVVGGAVNRFLLATPAVVDVAVGVCLKKVSGSSKCFEESEHPWSGPLGPQISAQASRSGSCVDGSGFPLPEG
jgi:hypothetical protein